jgi:hypothetical protein
MDDPRAIPFPVEASGQIQQAPGAFEIAAGGAAQGFEKDFDGQRRRGGRSPVAEIVEQVGEIRQIGMQQSGGSVRRRACPD